MTALVGVGLIMAAGGLLWPFLPRDGETHPLIGAGAMSWVVPLVITILIAFGLTCLLRALIGE